MATLNFEETIPWFNVSGDVILSEGGSSAGFGAPSSPNPTNRVIQRDQPTTIRFQWDQTGLLAPFLNGHWHCRLFFEQMGGGEYSLPGAYADNVTPYVAVNGHTYNVDVTIPANTIPEGLYTVVCALVFHSPTGIPGPIAAYSEFGLVQYYRA